MRAPLFLKSSPDNMSIDLRERERKIDVRNIDQLPLVGAPTQIQNPGMCTDGESNPRSFHTLDNTPTKWSTWPGRGHLFYRAPISLMRGFHPHDLITPKASPPYSITLAVNFQHMNLEAEHKNSVNDNHLTLVYSQVFYSFGAIVNGIIFPNFIFNTPTLTPESCYLCYLHPIQ